MTIIWTFENKEKLKPFIDLLNENDIFFNLLNKSNAIDNENGLIVSVEDNEAKRAKRLLLIHRKRIGNRHNR